MLNFKIVKMEKIMIIDTYHTPTSNDIEDMLEDSLVVMIDVLRASTTVVAALQNGAKEVIVSDSLEKAVKIYSSLSKGAGFLGGERAGLKPSGFDAGNSPADYSEELVRDKTVIITTTNGTVVFQKAKKAKYKVVGSFVNHDEVVRFINLKRSSEEEIKSVVFLTAGANHKLSLEDTICAGSMISAIVKDDDILTDSSQASLELFDLHKESIRDYIKSRDHAKKLSSIGFGDDIDLCLNYNLFPVLPLISGNSVKLLKY